MPTIKDFEDEFNTIQTVTTMFGCTEAFNTERLRRVQEIGKAICEEAGVEWGSAEAMDIPPETPLGSKAQALFADFCSWYDTQHKSAR